MTAEIPDQRIFLGDINVIAKCRIKDKKYSRKSELQEFVLAELKAVFGIMCFPDDYSRLTIDDYNHTYGKQHFEKKIGEIKDAIYEFQHPTQMVNMLHFYRI